MNAHKQFNGKIERLDLTKFVNTEDLNEDDKMLIQHMRKLLPAEVTAILIAILRSAGYGKILFSSITMNCPKKRGISSLNTFCLNTKNYFQN